jgi:hypothetical protein
VLVFLVAAATVAALLTPAQGARAQQVPCGLPDAHPLWFDYAEGSVTFRKQVFGRPGVIAATSGVAVAADLRSGGAKTVYWENKLGSLVGSSTSPADPSTIPAAVGKLFDKAVASSGCQTPFIGLNELNGPATTTPWTQTNTQYRANVLAFLQGLAARGARPFLLLPAAPYTDGDARAWWLQAAEVADIVPEVYFQAPSIMKSGPLLGSRRMRVAYRNAIAGLTSIGIPVSRLGLVIGFQSGPGTGGREGLQPTSQWLRFVKLQTLAAKQVAGELGLGTVWSWGWGTFTAAGADPDKQAAACVYLWTRSRSLCDGPAVAGSSFNASLTEGQIALPAGVQCAVDGHPISAGAIQALTAVTHDRDLATTTLFARAVEDERSPVSTYAALGLERRLIALRFHGSRPAYLGSLRARGASLTLGRDVLADALRTSRIERSLRVAIPTYGQIALFYLTYPQELLRLVQTDAPASWLGGARRGFALAPPAPPEVLKASTGVATPLLVADGPLTVTPLEASLPLEALPLGTARPAIRAALLSYARADAFASWSLRQQASALNRTTCLRDDLPSVGSVDLSTYLPFLALAA